MAHPVGQQTVPGNVNERLWWVGWRPSVAIAGGAILGLALGNAIAIPMMFVAGLSTPVSMVVFTGVGIGVGVVVWLRGVEHINGGYQSVLDSLKADPPIPRTDGEKTVLLERDDGSKPLVDPSPSYTSTALVVAPDSVTVYEGRLDLPSRETAMEERDEIRFEDIMSVATEGSVLRLETTDGTTRRFEATDPPEQAVATIEQGL